MRKLFWAVGLALSLAPMAGVTDAQAQATRTWVSGVGDDVNPCSRTAPCKTFAGAISKTQSGGIIDVLDPGGYGTVTITKSITIRGTGTQASILSSSTNGVIINGAGIVVNLIDLQIDGNPTTSPGLNGVRVLQASQVNIDRCRIEAFKGAAPNGAGVLVNAALGGARVLVKDSFIAGNNVGVDVLAPTAGGASSNGALIVDSVIDTNSVADLRANATKANIVIRGSTALGPVSIGAGALFRSYGDNAFDPATTPNSTIPLK